MFFGRHLPLAAVVLFAAVGLSTPSGAQSSIVPEEVVIEVDGAPTPDEVQALASRHGLIRVESQRFQLTGTTMFRWRIPDGRSVEQVVRELQADGTVRSAQPNYIFTVQQPLATDSVAARVDPSHYALSKLRVPLAHLHAKGGNVLVAVIDSKIDTQHPDLQGVVIDSIELVDPAGRAETHGTAVAGVIAAQGRRVMGVAPGARILAVRALGDSTGTGFNIIKGIEWATGRGAHVINMSFAGPRDPAMARALASAYRRGIVLVAAVGNAGPKSPPLYPGDDPNVIAVTATDEADRLFPASNRGRHIAVAAPGVDIELLAPGESYQFASGTSLAAAHVSGIVALLLERKPGLSPGAVRHILRSTARELGPQGLDDQFGAGLADALRAVTVPLPIRRRD
jgi:subtilisin family serine protease